MLTGTPSPQRGQAGRTELFTPLGLKIGAVTSKRQGTTKRAPTGLIVESARVYECSTATAKRIAKDFRQQIE